MKRLFALLLLVPAIALAAVEIDDLPTTKAVGWDNAQMVYDSGSIDFDLGGTDALSVTPTQIILRAGHSMAIGADTMLRYDGTRNSVYIGVLAGQVANADASSNWNVCLGGWSCEDLTGGEQNTLLGVGAGNSLTTSDGNVAVGTFSLFNAQAGYGQNVAVGMQAMNGTAGNWSAVENVAVGYRAMFALGASGSFALNNVGIGPHALAALRDGDTNTALGYGACDDVTTGIGNVCIGAQAGAASGNTTDRLFIDNSNTTTPLIGGDFSANTVTINGAQTVVPTTATGAASLTIDSSASSSFVKLNDNGTVEIDGDVATGSNLLKMRYNGTQMFNFSFTGVFEGGASASRDLNWAGGITTIAGGTGGIRGVYAVEAVTTTKTTAVGESFELYTNNGDTDGATITLLNDPAVGNCYKFAVIAAQTLTIVPSSGESLHMGTDQCNVSMTANAKGASVTICAAVGGSGGSWVSFGPSGFTCND